MNIDLRTLLVVALVLLAFALVNDHQAQPEPIISSLHCPIVGGCSNF
ncbi:hypothetical protein [Methylobacillus flagellatus]|nr:hypothetical protein [Methylobacillus flagellatus]